MTRGKESVEEVERVTLKLPKNIAAYFRKTFPHGKRSEFVAECIKQFKKDQEVKLIEDELKKIKRIK